MKICDAHIHTGQFREEYTGSEDVFDFLDAHNVEYFAASSICTCDGTIERVLPEMEAMNRLAGNRFVPVLWIAPEWIDEGRDELQRLLESEIPWKCLKIHGYYSRWDLVPDRLEKVVKMAHDMQLPLLLHTGGCEMSDAGSYKDLISRHPEVTFILAHCRPGDQALDVMKSCLNCWGDTAFTPPRDVKMLVDAGLSDRLMLGTDYPLHRSFYKGRDMDEVYDNTIAELRATMSDENWQKVARGNFCRLFHIS